MPARRAVLAGVAALLTAGCGARETPVDEGTSATQTRATDDEPGLDTTASEAGRTGSATPTDAFDRTARRTDEEPSPDLREANVVDVAVDAASGGYRFDVTLLHDDDGEDGYANWWVVEGVDGTELGRRELSHAHGTREFTRSATVDVGRRDCVVVRGHDQTHGYGGRAAVVVVETGATNAVEQGSDRRAFDAGDCP